MDLKEIKRIQEEQDRNIRILKRKNNNLKEMIIRLVDEYVLE